MTQSQDDIEVAQGRIVEEGHQIWAVLTYRGHTVKERIGRHILKWPTDKQSGYLDDLNVRLRLKWQRDFMTINRAQNFR